MRKLLLAGLAAVVSTTAVGGALGVSGSDTITNIAGNGVPGAAGDGGQATSARLDGPNGVAVDVQGAVYVADRNNNKVRRVSGGTITTFAGTGAAGSAGDGGQATSAQLQSPRAVAVDGQGNVYIADANNHKIRRVSGGTITTFAGTGAAGSSGDGGQATSAQLSSPHGVAVDGQGNVFIADFGNNKVRRVSGGVITTFAGTGVVGAAGDGGTATAAQLWAPSSVAVDTAGNVYIADLGNQKIRKVSGGTITTVAGTVAAGYAGDGGPAISAQLKDPLGVAVDGEGSVYIADADNQRVRKVTNGLPTASFTVSPSSGAAPLTVSVDGSGSSDPGGAITAHAWEFGDGGTATGATASHVYAGGGSFEVKLTVMDDSGATASAMQTVTVSGVAPPAPPPPSPRARVRCGGLAASIVGTARRNVIRGTPRRDVIAGLAGNDVIRGLGGNDVICGGPGRDSLYGGRGRDRLIGGGARDLAVGGPGRDSCTAERRRSC
jgi:PKD repeat protein